MWEQYLEHTKKMQRDLKSFLHEDNWWVLTFWDFNGNGVFVSGLDFYKAGVAFVNTRSLLLCFHLKASFVMHEGYVLWAIKVQILKQILSYIMLKYPYVLHHLQLYDIIQVMVLK